MMVAVCGALTIAAGFALLTPALASLTSLSSPATMQGEVLGLQQGSGALGRVLGPGASGALYDGYGANAPFLVGAIGMSIALLYARFSDRELHQGRDRDAEVTQRGRTTEIWQIDDEAGRDDLGR